jgi:hypothetical protein
MKQHFGEQKYQKLKTAYKYIMTLGLILTYLLIPVKYCTSSMNLMWREISCIAIEYSTFV